MREILFRGKRKDNGEWIEGFYIDSVCKNPIIGYITPSYPTEPIKVDKRTVCQYTGLKDKNGNKVFEGDIVKVKITQKEDIGIYGDCKYKVGFIVYNEDFALFTCKNNFMNFINWAFNEYKVIGNIFDNKEILG